jgi:predicted transcriptional regulator
MRQLTITLQSDWKSALRNAGSKATRGIASQRYQGEMLNFETPAQLFGQLTENRWNIVRLMQGAESMSVRELARRLERDPKRVLDDVRALIALGLIEKTSDDKITCPFSDIHVDLHLAVAA